MNLDVGVGAASSLVKAHVSHDLQDISGWRQNGETNPF